MAAIARLDSALRTGRNLQSSEAAKACAYKDNDVNPGQNILTTTVCYDDCRCIDSAHGTRYRPECEMRHYGRRDITVNKVGQTNAQMRLL